MTKESRQEEIMQQHAKSGKFGKKDTLQEIQEENRRLISHTTHLESNINEALRELRKSQEELDFNKISNSIFLARIALGDTELFKLLTENQCKKQQ